MNETIARSIVVLNKNGVNVSTMSLTAEQVDQARVTALREFLRRTTEPNATSVSCLSHTHTFSHSTLMTYL